MGFWSFLGLASRGDMNKLLAKQEENDQQVRELLHESFKVNQRNNEQLLKAVEQRITERISNVEQDVHSVIERILICNEQLKDSVLLAVQGQEKEVHSLLERVLQENKTLKASLLENIQKANTGLTLKLIQSNEAIQASIMESMRDVHERLSLLEEVLKLNWANQLLDQLESNIEEIKAGSKK